MNPTKNWGELICSRGVGSSSSTWGACRVTLYPNPVISDEWGKDRIVITTKRTYPMSSVTQIFCNHGDYHQTFEVMTPTWPLGNLGSVASLLSMLLCITDKLARGLVMLCFTQMTWPRGPGADPGFVVRGGGAWEGKGSGDHLRSSVGQGQSPGSGPRGAKPPRKLWGFEELQTFIWTTILNQPHHFYQTKKTLLWVLILLDNC